MDLELEQLSLAVGAWLSARQAVLTTAESCTGGWIAEVITATSGSSSWFDRGWITYSNAAKEALLGVQASTLVAFGAVSEAVVREMAEGALTRAQAGYAIAVSGIAGPTGGSAEKPVGTVCLAWARHDGPTHTRTCRFSGDREAVRRQTVILALQTLIESAG